VPSLGFSQGSFASVWLKSSSSAASHSDQLLKNRNIEAQIQENVGQIINASSKEQEYKNYVLYYIYYQSIPVPRICMRTHVQETSVSV
jgi:hypothetical protein